MKYKLFLIVIYSIFIAGCGNQKKESHTHNHDHDIETTTNNNHDHDHDQDHSHDHNQDHNHDNNHDHDKDHNHDHDKDHNHDHNQDHNQDHEPDQEHDQENSEEHDCNHDHESEDVHETHDHEKSAENVGNHEDELLDNAGQHSDNDDAKDDSHDGHNHEEVKIQYTAYTNNFEVFAEADAFVIKKSSNVLAHFSTLPDFDALNNGSVTISLIVDGIILAQTLDSPVRSGIYSFDIKPIKNGIGKLTFDINTKRGKFRIAIADVRVFDDEHEAMHQAAETAISETNTTVFTKEQSWKIEFATNLPKTEPFGQVIKTTARVTPAQGDEILVSAMTNGIVVFLKDDILEGENVSEGEMLFSISTGGFAVNNSAVRFMEAQNNYEKAKSDYERMKTLAEDKIVSERDLLDVKNKYDNARVIYNNLNENFNSSGQKVRSVFDGFIAHVFVENGQYVEPGQPLVRIAKNQKLLLRANVQQKYVPILGQIKSANICSEFDSKTFTLDQLNGKVLSYGQNTNHDNYLVPVYLQIDNNKSFIPGCFVDVYLKTITNQRALILPNSALIEELGNYFVFVQITPELFEKREVSPGTTDGLKTEILNGIAHNERVVTKGAVLIKLAQATGTLDAHSGHVH